MRLFVTLAFPLVLQIFAFIGVFLAAQGGGSFMGLFALAVAPVAVLALLVHGFIAARGRGSALTASLVSLAIAVLPPLGLMILKALES
jgi:hypothetical protein